MLAHRFSRMNSTPIRYAVSANDALRNFLQMALVGRGNFHLPESQLAFKGHAADRQTMTALRQFLSGGDPADYLAYMDAVTDRQPQLLHTNGPYSAPRFLSALFPGVQHIMNSKAAQRGFTSDLSDPAVMSHVAVLLRSRPSVVGYLTGDPLASTQALLDRGANGDTYAGVHEGLTRGDPLALVAANRLGARLREGGGGSGVLGHSLQDASQYALKSPVLPWLADRVGVPTYEHPDQQRYITPPANHGT